MYKVCCISDEKWLSCEFKFKEKANADEAYHLLTDELDYTYRLIELIDASHPQTEIIMTFDKAEQRR